MANIQHSTLAHANVHEPKHITINGTSASGKVITNSSTVSGTSEYRNLAQGDLTGMEVLWTIQEFDGSVQQTHYWPATYNGDITGLDGIVNIAVAGGSNTYELRINGVVVTGSPITFTTTAGTGGTAGDIVSSSGFTANSFAAGDSITLVNTSKANTETGLDIRFVITTERT
jgi:hypothetical protein